MYSIPLLPTVNLLNSSPVAWKLTDTKILVDQYEIMVITRLVRNAFNSAGILRCQRYSSLLRFTGGKLFVGHVSGSTHEDKSEFKSETEKFDENILKIIVCPLTKKPLRYDKVRQLLISEDIGVGYKVVNGIPNLVPQDGIKIDKDS